MKKTRKILALLMVAAMLLTLAQPITSYAVAEAGVFVEGNGTEESPYLISNKYQLDNVRNDLSAYYKLTCDIVFEYEDFEEDGDFYNEGAGFDPIGDDSNYFRGVFDGNGFAVKNLYIYAEKWGGSGTLAGLFGSNYGVIKNLSVVNGEIAATSTNNKVNAGGIAAIQFGTIENCYFSGIVAAVSTSTSSSYSAYAGGIVGNKLEGDIINCRNEGDVYASTEVEDAYAGGIAGAFGFSGNIENCYNTGAVFAISAGEYASASGIVNTNSGKVKNCYNLGSVYACAAGSEVRAGGIVAFNSGYIDDCYNTGDVVAIAGTAYAYAGGISGKNYGCIKCCYNAGNVYAVAIESEDYYGGAVVGYSNGEAFYSLGGTTENCYYLDIDDVSEGVGFNEGGENDVTKCTDDEMKDQATFAGFDFESVWTFDDTLNGYEYPVLVGNKHKVIVLGDLDGDGMLTAVDALMMKQYFVNILDENDIPMEVADINEDGEVNAKDHLMLKQKLAE